MNSVVCAGAPPIDLKLILYQPSASSQANTQLANTNPHRCDVGPNCDSQYTGICCHYHHGFATLDVAKVKSKCSVCIAQRQQRMGPLGSQRCQSMHQIRQSAPCNRNLQRLSHMEWSFATGLLTCFWVLQFRLFSKHGRR